MENHHTGKNRRYFVTAFPQSHCTLKGLLKGEKRIASTTHMPGPIMIQVVNMMSLMWATLAAINLPFGDGLYISTIKRMCIATIWEQRTYANHMYT